jgi:predicted ATPase
MNTVIRGARRQSLHLRLGRAKFELNISITYDLRTHASEITLQSIKVLKSSRIQGGIRYIKSGSHYIVQASRGSQTRQELFATTAQLSLTGVLRDQLHGRFQCRCRHLVSQVEEKP